MYIVLTESIHLLLECTEEIVPPRIEGNVSLKILALRCFQIYQAAIEKTYMKKSC
jgi:hypothetical protein